MPTTIGILIIILTFISMINTTSDRLKARNLFICPYFSFYEQLKFCAQFSWAWKKFYNLGASATKRFWFENKLWFKMLVAKKNSHFILIYFYTYRLRTVTTVWTNETLHSHMQIITDRNPGWVAQSLTYLNADTGVASSILAWSHTFELIDHEIISMAVLVPSADSRRVVVCYKRKYVHEVLVNCLVMLA